MRPILMWDPTFQLPAHPQLSQQLNTSVAADASWWSGESHHATVLEMVDVSYPGIDVPSGSSILIQMMFACGWNVTGGKGSTDTDFATWRLQRRFSGGRNSGNRVRGPRPSVKAK